MVALTLLFGDLLPHMTPLNIASLSAAIVSRPRVFIWLWMETNHGHFSLGCHFRRQLLCLLHLPPPAFQIPWTEGGRMHSGQFPFACHTTGVCY